MNRKRILILIIVLVAIAGLLSCTLSLSQSRKAGRESHELMVEARDNLYIGMTRNEVDQHVHTAWKHYLCDYEMFSISVYLFGSHDPDLAGVIFLRFKKEKGAEKLEEIASVDPYMLHEFEHCEVFEK